MLLKRCILLLQCENGRRPSILPSATGITVTGATEQQDSYEKSITCCTCGAGVAFWDEINGGFTLKHWEDHRQTCVPVIYTPENTDEALPYPPMKYQRTRRTEEERIAYLRADPYIAQFESFRVRCALCYKWIRLRSNSTYCSIPWDAHRRKCLAKNFVFSESVSVPPFSNQRGSAVNYGCSWDPTCFRGTQISLLHSASPISAQNTNAQPQRSRSHTVDDTSNDPAAGIAQQPTIAIGNIIPEGNYNLPLTNETASVDPYNGGVMQTINDGSFAAADYIENSQTLTTTYNPRPQMLSKSNVNPSSHAVDLGVDSTEQPPATVISALQSNQVTQDEIINSQTLNSVYMAQWISKGSLSIPNYLTPGHRSCNTFTSTHSPEHWALYTDVNNAQPYDRYGHTVFNKNVTWQSSNTAIKVPSPANYAFTLDENKNMYSRVLDGNTWKWHCNFTGCPYVSQSKRDTERHCSNLQHGGSREHECGSCGKVFVRADTLLRHLKKHAAGYNKHV